MLTDLVDHDKIAVRSGHGVGKDLEANEPVLTPDGWVPIGQLKRGDKVFAVDGTVCRVIQTWDWQDRDLYRVTLDDGCSVITGREHEWYTETRSERKHGKPGKVRTTLEIMDSLTFPNGPRDGLNHRIPTCGLIRHPEQELPIDPYALGVWLGDGLKGTGQYCKPDESVAENIREVAGHLPLQADGKSRTITGMTRALKLLGLFNKGSHERFVPDIYRFASPEQRHSLLQGLLDTDGTVGSNNAVTFDTSSEKLADHVSELVRSLGGVVRRSGRQGKLYGEAKRWSYRVYIALPPEFPPFRGRKARGYNPDWAHKNKRRTLSRFIEKVEKIGKGDTRCISISHPSHLYVTRDHIVTHNSTLNSWAILWYMATHYPVKIPCSAPTMHQLKDVLWSELATWHRRMPEALRAEFGIHSSSQDMRFFLKSNPDASFAVARTGDKSNPEALQGFHSPNIMFILDEASGIDDMVFEVAQGALSTPGAKVLMTANPTRTQGYFYDAFHKMRDRWRLHHVSCLDSPRVSEQYIEDVALHYGEDSNVYRVRVLGDFPDTEDDVLIPLYLIEAALERDIEPSNMHRTVWGLDVARYGDDRTALAKRQGNVLLEPVKFWEGADTMRTVGNIVREYELSDDPPDEILVDVIGLGAGVVDRLRELGLPVRGVNVAETPTADGFQRLRDELWWRVREWFESRQVKVCDDDNLIAELCSIKYDVTSTGKIKVESKDDLKKRGLRSPDLADAFVLTFAGGLDIRPTEREKMDRYERAMKRARSNHRVRRRSWKAV